MKNRKTKKPQALCFQGLTAVFLFFAAKVRITDYTFLTYYAFGSFSLSLL
jgi:hypothetical protein